MQPLHPNSRVFRSSTDLGNWRTGRERISDSRLHGIFSGKKKKRRGGSYDLHLVATRRALIVAARFANEDNVVILFFLAALAILFLTRNWGLEQLPPSPLALPIIGHLHLLGPLVHQSLRDISCRYGPLVFLRLGSVPCIVASTPDVAIELLKIHEASFSSRRDSLAVNKFTYNNTSFTFGPSGPYWKFIKKLCTMDLFSSRMLNQFQPLRTKELHYFLCLLLSKSKAGETVNLTQELLNLTNNVISQMLLSVRCFGKESLAEDATHSICEVMELLGTLNVSDVVWFCRYFDLQRLEKKSDFIHRKYNALLESIITERELIRRKEISDSENNADGRLKDFLDIMLDAFENENSEIQLTRNHIKALVMEFFAAGTDTTAIGIEWALAELINHPTVLEKARKEIDDVVGETRLVEESDVHNLVYLRAIIKETLRLHPPFPMFQRKSTEDCNVRGYKIPANTVIVVNTWSIGRDPRYWENQLEFLPERFLSGKESSRDVKGLNFELLPFGTGRRRCPGMSVALQTFPVTLAAIIQCFDLKGAGADEGNGNRNSVDMTEGPGLSTPRVVDLVCVPVVRSPRPLCSLET